MEHISRVLINRKNFPRRILSSPTKLIGGLGDPNCTICKGSGYYRVNRDPDEPHFGEYFVCPTCRPDVAATQVLAHTGLAGLGPIRPLDAIVTHDRTDTAKMVQACREFVRQPDHILMICGRYGNGKTTALRACVYQLAQAKVDAVYMSAHELLGWQRNPFGHDAGRRGGNPNWERALTVRVLAIDDLDLVHLTASVQAQFSQLLNARAEMSEAGKGGTLIVFHGDPAELGPWVTSRLNGHGNGVLRNDDVDIRPALKWRPPVS